MTTQQKKQQPRQRGTKSAPRPTSPHAREVLRELKSGYDVERGGGGHWRIRFRATGEVLMHGDRQITFGGDIGKPEAEKLRQQLIEVRALKGTEQKKAFVPPEALQRRIEAAQREHRRRAEARQLEANALRERLTSVFSFADLEQPGFTADLGRVGARIAREQGKEGMTPDLLMGSASRLLGGAWIEPRFQEVWVGLAQRLEDVPDKVGAWYGLVRETRGLAADAVHVAPTEGEWPFRIELLPLDALFVDTYQRPVGWGFVRREAARYDPALVGAIDVAQRRPSSFAILDGQQRVEIVRLVGKSTIYASIYVGLDLASESRFFLKKNGQRKNMHPFYNFRAAVIAEDEEAVAIDRIVREHGYRLGINVPKAGGEDIIAAIAGVTATYRRRRPDGSDALSPTLELLRSAAHGREGGRQSLLIRGIGRVFGEYGPDDLDAKLLSEVVADSGPELLLGRARDLSRSRGTSGELAMAQVVTTEYDRRAPRGRKLAWQRMLEAA